MIGHMTTERRFLIPSSIARLIQRQHGAGLRVAEGHFPSSPDRSQFVRVGAAGCHLVLLSMGGEGESAEERTEIPRSQAEALLDVCAGTIAYDRSILGFVPGSEVLLDRIITPKRVDLLTVLLDEGSSRQFDPPAWFGSEVTDDHAYDRHSIAVNGPPEAGDVTLSNAGLESLLDAIEQQAATDSEERAQDSFSPKPLSLGASQLSEPRVEPIPALRSYRYGSRAGAPADMAVPAASNRDEVLDGMMANFARALVAPASSDEEDSRNLVEVFNSAARGPARQALNGGETR